MIDEKIAAIQSFSFVEETKKIIDENSEFILNLIRTQLEEGKSGTGEDITLFGSPYYNESTIRSKSRSGNPISRITDHITLHMSGDFYAELYIISRPTDIEVFSNVPYEEDIFAMSGAKVIQLNPTSLEILRNEILVPQLKAAWKSRIS